ncbi:MAG: hypothetical protein NC086_03805 [Alistipes sp.]|nr:hypothetical protein [Alistipes sp.]
MSLYESLREQYREFLYESYEITKEDGQIAVRYHFKIPGLAEFAPVWRFDPAGHDLGELLRNKTFLRLVFSLGMVELVSYWKTACPKTVRVLCGALDDKQCGWWKKLYFHGLGEFFYTNGMEPDYDEFMRIISEGGEEVGEEAPLSDNEGCMVPIGGGKDSVVSVELLRSMGEHAKSYIINPRGATINTTIAGKFADEDVIVAKRTLDKRMIELNAKGFLNGHTPFSAIVAFSATIAAFLHNLKYIVLSNEASANESTVLGSTVNHQYSKSFQFEKDFHEYEARYLKTGTYYFSLLRPLSEFQIARYFAKCTAYHDIFRSCNVGSKEDVWCGHCAKCLFVFLILSPFLSHERLCGIFGADMVNDKSLIPVMEQLCGVVDEKPFECVGSRDEVNTAVCMTIAQWDHGKEELPVLLRHYRDLSLYEEYSHRENMFFTGYEEENLLPEKYAVLVKENCCKA